MQLKYHTEGNRLVVHRFHDIPHMYMISRIFVQFTLIKSSSLKNSLIRPIILYQQF